MNATKGVILFAHGSRDPLWRRPIEAVAEQLRAQQPEALCRCAYLELNEPDLATAVGELVRAGCTQVRVLPMFLGTGRHAREDLPQLVASLRQNYPETGFEIATAVGEDEQVTRLLADLAQRLIA